MRRWKSFAVVAALAMIVAACSPSEGGDQPTTTAGPGTTAPGGGTTTTEGDMVGTECKGQVLDTEATGEVRWFVGLGAGAQPEQIAAQDAFVEAFNDSQDRINLVVEYVDNDVAYEALATQITAGNAPDIIGPVGSDGANAFAGLYEDLQPLVDAAGVDVSLCWPLGQVDAGRDATGALLGLPFASFPSFVYYNRDLFDEAGLPYPPQEYGPDGTAIYGAGTDYEGVWDYDKVAEIAAILTVDENGLDATEDGFDNERTVQWGFHWQWIAQLYQQGNQWGEGFPFDQNGNASIPQSWKDEWNWWHDAIWEVGFMPSQAEIDLFGSNVFQSGNLAMAVTHLWYTCCISSDDSAGDFFDLAVMPSRNGTVTTNMHADTFRILQGGSADRAATFEVLWNMVTDGSLDLLLAYGAAPAIAADTDAFFAGLDERYPQGVNWQVALDSAQFASTSFEAATPNDSWQEYKVTIEVLERTLSTDPNVDVDAAIADLEQRLNSIFTR